MASNEKVVLCGIAFDKENAPDYLKLGEPNLGTLKRMEDGTFFGMDMNDCIGALVIIDDYIKDGDIFIDFVNKEVWVYENFSSNGGLWIGPADTKFGYGNVISVEEYKNPL